LKSISINVDKPTPIFQDNQSTILIAQQGGNFKRTKHLICKESYVREHVSNGDIALKFLPTEKIPADMFTKPASKKILTTHMKFLHVR
jgi:hypothetical protein